MVRISALMVAICCGVAVGAEHKVTDKDMFPKTVAVGDTIVIERPGIGGRNSIDVKVNGKPVKVESKATTANGKPLLGGGKLVATIKAAEAGKLEIEIVTTIAGEKEKKNEKHEVEVKK